MPRLLLGVLALAAVGLSAAAQAPAPADAVKAQIAKFKEERAAAEKTFTKEELAAADEQVAKAEAALAAGNAEQAGRLITDARWQLPVQQTNLPENVIRVLGASRLRHGDRVNAVAYSPDGGRLASASRDGTVRVWDVGNGREVAVYRGHEAAKYDDAEDRTKKDNEKRNVFRVAGVSFSADGKRVASAGSDEIHIWEADTGKLVKTLKGHKGDVKCVAFGPKTADLLLSGGDDKKFMVWDVTKDKPTHTSDEMGSRIEAVAFSGDEGYVAAVDNSGSGVVFAVGQWAKPGYGGGVSDSKGSKAVAFARDGGGGFFAAGDDGKIKLIGGPAGPQASVGNLLVRFDGHSGPVVGLGVTADGKLLASLAEKDRTVIVWEAATGKQIRAYQVEQSAKLGACLAVRPDGRQVAAGFESGQIRLFPLSNTDDHRTFADGKEKLMAAAYSPDGKQFATAGGDAVVRVYETATGALTKELKGHKIAVTAVAWVTNGTLASAGADKVVKVWDVAAGTAKDAVGHSLAVLAVASDPNGKVLVSGGADKSVRGWNPSTGEATKWKYEGTSAVCAVAVSPDATKVAVGCANGKLLLFAVKDDALVPAGEVAAQNAGVAAVAFHPNGDRVATCGGDGTAKLWTLADGTAPAPAVTYSPPFKPAPGAPPVPVTSVAFSPDGKQVVAGGSEGVVRIWDTLGGSEARGLRGHTGWVTSVQFHPDGKSVLSCSVDATARVFDLPRGEAAATGHSASVTCVAVSRDGKYAATGSEDTTVMVWDLASGREVATLTGESDKENNGGVGIIAAVFVGNDKVAACGHEKQLRTWTFRPNKLLSARKQNEKSFVLAADADGKSVAAAWVDGTTDKPSKSGFDLFVDDPGPVSTQLQSKSKDDATSAAALSPDAKWGVIGGKDGVISIWDVAKKERIGGDWPILGKGAAVMDIGLTPDRKRVVVIDEAGEVKVGDTDKREVTASVKAVTGEVRGVIVAPTADKFATLAGDGTVKAWDMNCKEVRTWKLPHTPTCAVFTADGKRLITGNQDGTAFVLELPK